MDFLVAGLLFVEFIAFIFGFFILWKKDKFVSLFWCVLYLYSTPALIGYYFFPELSSAVKAYFGGEMWMGYYAFVVLSLLSFFVVFMLLSRIPVKKSYFKILTIGAEKNSFVYWGLGCILIMLIIQIFLVIKNQSMISWGTIQSQEYVRNNFLLMLGSLLFKLSVAYNLALLCILRKKMYMKKIRAMVCVVFLISVLFFLYYAVLSGNRTDVLAFMMGVAFIEISLGKINKKTVGIYVGVAVVGLVFMMFIAFHRDADFGVGRSGLMQILLAQDYYYPIHILFAAIRYQVIEPLEVIASNFCNSLVMLNYPYLQQEITDLFNPGVATRSTGYAFYAFTEGYLFMGNLGFIYNGIVYNLFLRFWKRIANSNDKDFNVMCKALMVSHVVNICRGQSSYFIKYLYTSIFIGLIFYFLLNGKRFRIIFSRRDSTA